MTGPPITVVATEPAPPGSSALDALLYPMTQERFRHSYWQRRPLHITGWPGRFEGLFDREAFRRALTRQHDAGLSVRVSGDHDGDGGGAGAHVLVDAADVGEHLTGGTSVCVDPIDRADPAVAALAAQLTRELGFAGSVSVKCYFSTPGFGFNTHFDAHVVTTLQIEGHKRWRVSAEPGVAFPIDNAFLDGTGEVRYIGRLPSAVQDWERPAVNRSEFVDIELAPGDVLCLPAGTWHEAKAAGGSSLALNVSFTPADVLGHLVDRVAGRLQSRLAWRSGLPLPTDPSDPEAVAAAHRQCLRARLDELIETLHHLRDDPDLASAPSATLRPRQAPASVANTPAALPAGVPGSRLQCVLGVGDVERAAQWYGRVLGSSVVSRIPEFGWVEISTPVTGVTLGLTEMATGVQNRGAALDFSVDDVEQMRDLLAENGVLVTEAATEIAGLATFLNAHDQDGNRLMFFSEPGSTRPPVDASRGATSEL